MPPCMMCMLHDRFDLAPPNFFLLQVLELGGRGCVHLSCCMHQRGEGRQGTSGCQRRSHRLPSSMIVENQCPGHHLVVVRLTSRLLPCHSLQIAGCSRGFVRICDEMRHPPCALLYCFTLLESTWTMPGTYSFVFSEEPAAQREVL